LNRVNNQITDTPVLVIDENGNNLGTLATTEAIKLAHTRSLDLVEVGRGVCKIQDFEKFQYQQKKAHKTKPAPDLKEFRFNINIADHDLQTKARHINELLEKGHPIRLIVRFHGREITRPEQGFELLEKIKAELTHFAMDTPKREGNQILTMLRKS
jgi:translation initiation factor IF-3